MSLKFAERACRDNVGWHVLPAVPPGMLVFGGEVEQIHAMKVFAVPLGEGARLGQPHRVFAIEAAVALRAEGPLSKNAKSY